MYEIRDHRGMVVAFVTSVVDALWAEARGYRVRGMDKKSRRKLDKVRAK